MISTVSSVGGRHGLPGWAVYNATKFAVVGLHDAQRKELGEESIRVSLIEPGAIYTNWGYNVEPEAMKQNRDTVEALQADDIAKVLVYSFTQPAERQRTGDLDYADRAGRSIGRIKGADFLWDSNWTWILSDPRGVRYSMTRHVASNTITTT